MSDAMQRPKPVRVLIVEDSTAVREFLVGLFASQPDIEVAGVAADGEEGVAQAARLRPDVITMDINMPRLNGFEATQRIMRECPAPIVIVSGAYDPKEIRTTFAAMEAGALAVVPRPQGFGHPDHATGARDLVRAILAMAEVKVVRRWAERDRPGAVAVAASARPAARAEAIGIVAIGASTGGPSVLREILALLPRSLPFPIAIVQHMAVGFVGGFAEWLSQSAGFPVSLAVNGDTMLPGKAYVAPDGVHLNVGSGNRIVLNREPAEGGLRPSVGQLFRSVARVHGARSAAVLLTGMGSDGARELKELRDSGALTVVQDEASSAVYGMPGSAVQLRAATRILSPPAIAALVARCGETERPGVGVDSAPLRPDG